MIKRFILFIFFLATNTANAQNYGYLPFYTTASLPACSSTFINRVVVDTDLDCIVVCDGSSWVCPTGTTPIGVACGRLTLTSGIPITASDVTSATNIYYTPYNCNQIALYNGSSWDTISFSEITCALGTLTNAKNYDVFIYNNSGTATCEFSAAWTNDSTRADALTLQDGVNVKSGATTRRYVGTFRTTSTTTTEDSGGGSTTQVGGKRFVWNQDNRIGRWGRVIDTADVWSYEMAAWRVSNGATAPANCNEFVTGQIGMPIEAHSRGMLVGNLASGTAGAIGVGVNSSTVVTGLRATSVFFDVNSGTTYNAQGDANTIAALGYNYVCWIEYGWDSDLAVNFCGDRGEVALQNGSEIMVEQ